MEISASKSILVWAKRFGSLLESESARVRPNSRPSAGKPGRAISKVLAAILMLFSCSACSSPSSTNLLRGTNAQEAAEQLFKEKIGHNAKVLRLEITPLSLALRVQDPAKPTHIDSFSLNHYNFRGIYHLAFRFGPSPIDHGLSNDELEESLFELSDVNLAAVPAVTKSALEGIAIEGGQVDRICIQKRITDFPRAIGDLRWEISVRSDRESATAYADAKGRITGINIEGTSRARSLNLYSDAEALKHIAAMVREEVGKGPCILRLTLSRNSMWFEAIEPKKQRKIISYTANLSGVRGDSVGARENALSPEAFFSVDAIDWSRVPEMLKRAQAELNNPKGRIERVGLSKPLHPGDSLRWEIGIRNEDGDTGEVYFDAGGAVLRRPN